MVVKICVLTAACVLLTVATEEHLTVQINAGLVQGIVLSTWKGRSYTAFQGIPYAEPITENKRFQVSEPKKPWTGVWIADRPGPPCLQYRHALQKMEKIVGDEDCLYINVYTPQLPKNGESATLDVIVFIHGGAFMFGSGDLYGPNHFMNRDVVYVTFNYRLGILGFLSTEDDIVPGNNGMKDQVLALKWVKDNIAAFGGNPESITIMGQSAGGASVHYHYLSNMSIGLFNKGVSISGTALCPWAYAEGMRSKALQVGICVGCMNNSSEGLINCLRGRSAQKIVACTELFQTWLYNPFSPFGPTSERGDNEDKFISEPPVEIMISKNIQNLPWMTSVTTAEGLYPVAEFMGDDKLLEELNVKFNRIAPSLLDFNYTVKQESQDEISETIRQHYFGHSDIGLHNVKQLIKMVSDVMFVLHAEDAAQLQANIKSAPVYFYQYDYRGQHSISEIFTKTKNNYGASHSDDIVYLTDTKFVITNETEEDRQMSEVLLDTIINFIKTKIPGIPINENLTWKPVVPLDDELSYLYIGSPKQMVMRKSYSLGNREFWRTVSVHESEKTVVLTPQQRLVDEL